jgi:hypothetical protein
MKLLKSHSVICLLGLAACVNEPTENSVIIKTGTSLGECMGYCSLEATITSNNVYFTSSSWDTIGYPTNYSNNSIGGSEWNDIINSINMDKFKKLDDVIGCPDCADGGSEWIEIIFEDKIKKVTFEYGDSLEGINDLLAKLRIIRNKYHKNSNSKVHYINSF